MAQALAGERVAATYAQQGIWVTEQAGLAATAYHMPLSVDFTGDLDVPCLRDACSALVERHPVLGQAVVDVEGAPCLGPAANRPEVSWSDLNDRPDMLPQVVEQEIRRRFDLRSGPLARFTLIRVAPDRHVLLFVAHHLVFDGASKDVLVRDLA